MNNTTKTLFRRFVGVMPKSVHRMFTRYQISNITKFLLPEETVRTCENNESYRKKVIQVQKEKYPLHAAKISKGIEKLFASNPNYCNFSEDLKRSAIADIEFCYFGYGFPVFEYVFLDLGGKNKNAEARHAFVSDTERFAFRFSANDFTNDIYADKSRQYQFLKPFYKRDAVVVSGEGDRGNFMSFIHNKDKFVEKLVNSSGGKGVRLIDLNSIPGGGKVYFDSIKSRGKFLLEEVITQSPEMARFNSDSVNTVRVFTFNTREGIIVKYGFFRTGRKGAFVDNAAAGGVFSSIDTDQGCVNTESCDEFGNWYRVHPDTGISLNGFKLPDWNQAVELCKNAALLTPDLKYLGWDLAYSEKNGWMLVEVNTSGQFVNQAASREGIKPGLNEIVDKINFLVPYTFRNY